MSILTHESNNFCSTILIGQNRLLKNLSLNVDLANGTLIIVMCPFFYALIMKNVLAKAIELHYLRILECREVQLFPLDCGRGQVLAIWLTRFCFFVLFLTLIWCLWISFFKFEDRIYRRKLDQAYRALVACRGGGRFPARRVVLQVGTLTLLLFAWRSQHFILKVSLMKNQHILCILQFPFLYLFPQPNKLLSSNEHVPLFK